jgi:hypothetical protein
MERTFDNSRFSKNVNILFKGNYNNNKQALNLKLKNIIDKDKALSDRKIVDFDFIKILHNFKKNMKQFDEGQLKRKNLYTTLTEENKKFIKVYQKNYSINVENSVLKDTKNIKSKTCQKFYYKLKVKDLIRQKSNQEENNIFKKDPLLVSKNGIRTFYLNKDIKNQEDYTDEAITYLDKLERNIHNNSIINKVKNKIASYKMTPNKILNLTKDNFFPSININDNKKEETNENKMKIKKKNKIKDKNKNKSLTKKSKNYQKFSMDIKNYNKNIKEMLSNMNKTTNCFRKVNNHAKIDVHYKNKNLNKTIVKKYSDSPSSKMNSLNYFSSFSNQINNKPGLNLTAEINTQRKNLKVSNQIESIYNQLDKIQKTIRNYEKRNELDIKYLYSLYSHEHDPEKIFKQSNIQDEKLIKLNQELVHSVNSFNN